MRKKKRYFDGDGENGGRAMPAPTGDDDPSGLPYEGKAKDDMSLRDTI